MPKHSPRAFFTVRCPYCDRETKLFRPLSPAPAQEVIFCDPDEGGCDHPFVVFYHAVIVAARVAALADELPPPAPIPPLAPDAGPFSPGILAEEIAEAQALLALAARSPAARRPAHPRRPAHAPRQRR